MNADVILLTPSGATRDQVAATLGELEAEITLTSVESLAQLRHEISQGREADVVLIDEAAEMGTGYDVAREVIAQLPLAVTMMLVQHLDESAYANALDVGAKHVLQLPPSLDAFAQRFDSAMRWSQSVRQVTAAAEAPTGSAGKVIALVGAKGGVGTSTLAVAAAQLAAGSLQTCLVDLDVREGDLAAYCGMTVRRSVVDLVEIADELNARSLGEVTYPATPNLSLVPAPPDGELGEELDEHATRQVLTALRFQYDVVIVDVGTRVDEVSVQALDQADTIFVVATPDVPALRSVRRLVETMERLGCAIGVEPTLILNRAQKLLEVQPASAGKLADMQVAFSVPDLTKELDPVQNSAQLLKGSTPGLDAAMRPLAASLPRRGDRKVEAGRDAEVELESAEVAATRGLRRRSRRQRGQVAVEFPAMIALVLATAFLGFHMMVWGFTYLFANGAAQDAARAYGIGMSQVEVQRVVEEALPGLWSSQASVSQRSGEALVRVTPPITIGLPDVSATSTIFWEGR